MERFPGEEYSQTEWSESTRIFLKLQLQDCLKRKTAYAYPGSWKNYDPRRNTKITMYILKTTRTYKEIGLKYNMTPERVRQIGHKTIGKVNAIIREMNASRSS